MQTFLRKILRLTIKTVGFAHNFGMLVLVRIVLAVYIIAINVYAFMLVKSQKTANEEGKTAVGDGKLFLAAALGGALAVYVSLFIFKYRLTNLFLMVIIPVLIAVNAYLVIILIMSDFGLGINAVSAYYLANLSLR